MSRWRSTRNVETSKASGQLRWRNMCRWNPGAQCGSWRTVRRADRPPATTISMDGSGCCACYEHSHCICSDQALNLGLTTDQAAAVGVGAFAIAWEILINGNQLSETNVIPANSLEETTTIPTTTTQTTMTETTTTEEPCPTQYCNAACTLIGAIAACRTTCVTPTGTSCSATSTPIQVTTTATIPWTVSVNDLEPEPTPSFYARILPLGASIVWGVGSSTGNGYV